METTLKFDEIEDWLVENLDPSISWSELAERLLAREHSRGKEHQPDKDRRRRCGFGEVIFGERKSVDAICSIASELLASGLPEVLVTRVDSCKVPAVSERFPFARYDSLGRTLRVSLTTIQSESVDIPPKQTQVVVATAGSTDLPVAREAIETLRWMRVPCELITDIGVAGPYRIIPHLPMLRAAKTVVVVAGMEGALASAMGGFVASPVIAVPTSVGYGANFQGVTTLLSMMSSCAAGVTTVNIDAGFKGGYVAGLIAMQSSIRAETR